MTSPMRRFFEKHERKFLIALVIFLLVIFTVMSDVSSFLAPDRDPGTDPNEIAGRFEMPRAKVDVTYGEYGAARRDISLLKTLRAGFRGRREDVSAVEVWRYLILREGAKRAGVRVSDSALRETITGSMSWATDTGRYRDIIRGTLGVEPAVFEEALRDHLAVGRLEQLYQFCFMIAPAATREEVLKDALARILEYVRGDYAVLSAANFVDIAGEEFRAKPKEEREKELEAFYDRDSSVRSALRRFELPIRYDVEFLYTIHKNLNEESLKKIEALFKRAYPDYDQGLEETEGEMRAFYSLYRDRLLKRVGMSWKTVKEKATAEFNKKKKGDDGGEKKEDGDPKDGDPKDGDPKKKEGTDGEDVPPTPELRKAWQNHGFSLVQETIDRELRVRSMYRAWHAEIRKTKDVKGLFEKLKKADDPNDAICATESGKGLIVYLAFDKPIAADDIEDLEDSGVRFTHNVRTRITQTATKAKSDLPQLHRHADTMGAAGHGRMIIRLNKVEPRRRKTFAELSADERADLVKRYLLPTRARTLAKKALEKLRKECLADSLDDKTFLEKAEDMGCRIYRNEWVTATEVTPTEASPERLWKDELAHMRARRFLVRGLLGAFRADASKKKIKAGSYLEVMVQEPDGLEEDGPGAAYLFLVKERLRPDAKTLPRSNLAQMEFIARNASRNDYNKRWNEEFRDLFKDFGLKFFGPMEDDVNSNLKKIASSKSTGG